MVHEYEENKQLGRSETDKELKEKANKVWPQEELDQLEEDILNPRNFHNSLYQDDNFLQLKAKLAEDMIEVESA